MNVDLSVSEITALQFLASDERRKMVDLAGMEKPGTEAALSFMSQAARMEKLVIKLERAIQNG